jgi:hypothetical protein
MPIPEDYFVRITVDAEVVQVYKNNDYTTTDYTSPIDALNAAKTIIENEIAELES